MDNISGSSTWSTGVLKKARGCHFDTLNASRETQLKVKSITVIEELKRCMTEKDAKSKYSKKKKRYVKINSGTGNGFSPVRSLQLFKILFLNYCMNKACQAAPF